MSKPTRFPNGINNAVLPSVLENMGQLDHARFHTHFNDFTFFGVPISTNYDRIYNILDNGTPVITNEDEEGGVVKFTNASLIGNEVFISTFGDFNFAEGKKSFFKARFKLSSPSTSSFVAGLAILSNDPITASDAVYFTSDSLSDDVDFIVRKNNVTSTASAIHTMVNDTFVEVGFVYNGVDKVDYFVNNQKLGFLDTTNLPDDELINAIMGNRNGVAASTSISIDYLFAANER